MSQNMSQNDYKPQVPQVTFAGVRYNSLKGQGVIVTGGASGIGADIVRAFAGQGCRVGFVDLMADAGRALAASLPDTHFEPCDVTDVPALQAAIARLIVQIGGVDVLVNNVANDQRHKIEEIEERRVGKECLRLCRSRWSPYH